MSLIPDCPECQALNTSLAEKNEDGLDKFECLECGHWYDEEGEPA